MPRHAEPQLTPEQLLQAWRHLNRPGWPPTLDEALAHPLRGPCVRGLARQFARERLALPWRYVPPTPAHAPEVPATPTAPRAITAPRHMHAPRFDAKRAAANDRDD